MNNEQKQPKRTTLQEDPDLLIDEETGEYKMRDESSAARPKQNAQTMRGNSVEDIDEEDMHTGESKNNDRNIRRKPPTRVGSGQDRINNIE